VSVELDIGQCATLACLLEVIAPKAGNVHRAADFEDLTLRDFMLSATLIAPTMQNAEQRGVGRTVLDAIRATRQAVNTNTNLGTVLLLAPLAAVPRHVPLRDGVGPVLQSMKGQDSRDVYAAIRIAQPGGMGRVDQMDVQQNAPADLLAAMQAAADRDLVAMQYASGFETVLAEVAPRLQQNVSKGWLIETAIIETQLQLLCRYPDSLISRKCGKHVAEQAAAMADRVLRAGDPHSPAFEEALADLDFWMRADHHRRNPGTTADLIAAGLFAALREGHLRLPLRTTKIAT
jgi:triphosphoribosyl-dephospho-CoA synthase